MLTPEDIRELKPQFEEIRRLLNSAYIRSEPDISDEACDYYILALDRMEELVEKVTQEEGHSVRDALKRVVSPQGASVLGGLGGLGGAATSLSFTGLGGFGLAAGGTAVGKAGLAGATIAAGGGAFAGAGVALAGAGALYLAYKGGAAALETELGQKAAGHVADAGSKAAEQAKSVGSKAKEGLSRFRDRFSGSEPKDSTED